MTKRLTDPPTGQMWLWDLKFTKLKVLRRLTIRVMFTRVSDITFGTLPIASITSPVFSEFVLELGGLSSHPGGLPPEYWGRWERIDGFFKGRFANHGEFKLVIRTGELHNPETFQRHAKVIFPSLASGGCLHFEMTPSMEKHWP
jgi:hypothetical protein